MICTVTGYLLMFASTPIFVRKILDVDPFKYTRGFANIQAFNDLAHVGILTQLVFCNKELVIPEAVFIYFCLDIVFYSQTFVLSPMYLVHHVFACFIIYILQTHCSTHIQTLAFAIWLQETALIPINIIDILKMQSHYIPQFLLIIRALWYLSTRVITYGIFFCTYDETFPSLYTIVSLFTPLMLHNTFVFKRQILAIIHRYQENISSNYI